MLEGGDTLYIQGHIYCLEQEEGNIYIYIYLYNVLYIQYRTSLYGLMNGDIRHQQDGWNEGGGGGLLIEL